MTSFFALKKSIITVVRQWIFLRSSEKAFRESSEKKGIPLHTADDIARLFK